MAIPEKDIRNEMWNDAKRKLHNALDEVAMTAAQRDAINNTVYDMEREFDKANEN